MVRKRTRVYLKLMRVEQWYKNGLVMVPAVFALKLVDPSVYPPLALGFVSLSLASSSIYIFNDIRDIESDKLHPRKRNRPLPSGQVSTREAASLSAFLSTASLALSLTLNPLFALLVALFICLSLLYSLLLKRVEVVDVTAIAVNYLIRVVSGAVLIGVEASPWLVSGFFFLALFLALSKRKAELTIAGSSARSVLKAYSEKWLDQALSMAAAMTIVTYAIYCAEVPLGRRLVPTIPVMAFFLLRYTLAMEKGAGEHPHEVILNDKPTLIAAAALVISVLILAYLPLTL
ncbi:MAG: UbiA prenyltransferase family protein [Thermofilaceae archaeon]